MRSILTEVLDAPAQRELALGAEEEGFEAESRLAELGLGAQEALDGRAARDVRRRPTARVDVL